MEMLNKRDMPVFTLTAAELRSDIANAKRLRSLTIADSSFLIGLTKAVYQHAARLRGTCRKISLADFISLATVS
jgi:hypothetical protein